MHRSKENETTTHINTKFTIHWRTFTLHQGTTFHTPATVVPHNKQYILIYVTHSKTKHETHTHIYVWNTYFHWCHTYKVNELHSLSLKLINSHFWSENIFKIVPVILPIKWQMCQGDDVFVFVITYVLCVLMLCLVFSLIASITHLFLWRFRVIVR